MFYVQWIVAIEVCSNVYVQWIVAIEMCSNVYYSVDSGDREFLYVGQWVLNIGL